MQKKINTAETNHIPHTPWLLRVAPPPRFLEMTSAGVDISDTHLRVVMLERGGKGGYILKLHAEEALPKGVLENGDIIDATALEQKIVEFGAKYRLHFVRVSISEEKAYLFKTTIPRVPKKEIRKAVEFRLQENVPIPLSETIFDYTMLSGSSDHADHFDLEVAALPRKIVEAYVALFKKAGMQPLSFLTEAQAMMHAVIPKGNKDTVLIVDIEPKKTGLYVISGEAVHFTSTVPVGGATIAEVLQTHLQHSPEEAEAVKHEGGLERHKDNDELFFSLMSPLSALKDEIRKVIMYWENRDMDTREEKTPISRIILSGKDSAISGLDTYLAESLKKRADIANVWVNVMSLEENIPTIPRLESLNYASAIGAALPRH